MKKIKVKQGTAQTIINTLGITEKEMKEARERLELMRYIVKPGLRYPDWELYTLVNADEMFICEIQAANAADALDSAQQIVKWFNQEPMEFEA